MLAALNAVAGSSIGVTSTPQITALPVVVTPGGPNAGYINLILNTLYPISHMLTWVIMAMGVVLVAKGIHRFKQHAEQGGQQLKMGATVAHLVMGSILMQYNSVLADFGRSFFNGMGLHFYTSVLSYATTITHKMSQQQAMMHCISAMMLVVGGVAFVRGAFILTKLGESSGGEHSTGKALTHMLAGVAGANFTGLYALIAGVSGLAH
jgi:hypothetical protein